MSGRRLSGALLHHFSETLNTYFSDSGKVPSATGLAVAYSGGLDSSVLLTLSAHYCESRGIPLTAFHVHHGLSSNADVWLAHCQSVCDQLGVQFSFEKIIVSSTDGEGVEGSARKGRYLALGRMSLECNIGIVLAAHHQDDQAETLLMQMLRGSGIAGLSGMDKFNLAPSLFGTPDVMMMRPLLDVSRAELECFASEHQIAHIEDESNDDVRFLRNALRHQVMPALEQISPGFATRMSRTSKHMQSTLQLIEELAGQDLSSCLSEEDLSLNFDAIRHLSADRVGNLFRLWLHKIGTRMPSTSRLNEIRKQLFEAKGDARITIYHETLAIHRYKDRIYAADRSLEHADGELHVDFIWSGQESMVFPEFHGTLYCRRESRGLNPAWLEQQSLRMHLRKGGERLKLAENRSTRDMKSHYQALRVPFWLRQQLPFISIGDQLLFAAGVGMQSKYCDDAGSGRIVFEWVAD
ncbi:tRNA lysidine(34) synthetase TilS [Undibacterium sp. RuRC25W]|uniref:tRNA lysidine(34) synthetase TilS n=1 Tax=Undibacterium sp. RuRC25W TaxID=3413047 RepID=UPI003BF34FA5